MDKDPHVNITKNMGRGTNTILKGLLGQRKLVNKTSVHPKLREYVLENQSQVCILHNDEETGGINISTSSSLITWIVMPMEKMRIKMEVMLFVLLLSCWTQSIALLLIFI